MISIPEATQGAHPTLRWSALSEQIFQLSVDYVYANLLLSSLSCSRLKSDTVAVLAVLPREWV